MAAQRAAAYGWDRQLGPSMAGIDLYQSYLGEAQRRHLDARAIPTDVADSVGPGQREYDLFKRVQQDRRRTLRGTDRKRPWGLVSWKFEQKCLLSIADFLAFAEQRLAEGFDCAFINPMVGNLAIDSNVWSQWAASSPATARMLAHLNTVIDLQSMLFMPASRFAFCNYFVATPAFWDRYFRFVDGVLEPLERHARQQTAIGQLYLSSGNYARDRAVTMRPFLIERLFSTLLCLPGAPRAAAFLPDPALCVRKFGTGFGGVVTSLLQARTAVGDPPDADALGTWQAMVGALGDNDLLTLWLLDDPSEAVYQHELRRDLRPADPRLPPDIQKLVINATDP